MLKFIQCLICFLLPELKIEKYLYGAARIHSLQFNETCNWPTTAASEAQRVEHSVTQVSDGILRS